MTDKFCNCEIVGAVARDMKSTCMQCGGIDAYKKSPLRSKVVMTDTREAFEKWMDENYLVEIKLDKIPKFGNIDNTLCEKAFNGGYQAAEAHYKERIAELEKAQKVYIGVDLGSEERTTIAFIKDRTVTSLFEGGQAIKILEYIDQAIADSK